LPGTNKTFEAVVFREGQKKNDFIIKRTGRKKCALFFFVLFGWAKPTHCRFSFSPLFRPRRACV
jgi:hypothetical protein